LRFEMVPARVVPVNTAILPAALSETEVAVTNSNVVVVVVAVAVCY
jgi:hypothetical protein